RSKICIFAVHLSVAQVVLGWLWLAWGRRTYSTTGLSVSVPELQLPRSSTVSSLSILKKRERHDIKEQSFSKRSFAGTARATSFEWYVAWDSASMKTPCRPSSNGASGPACETACLSISH